MSNFRMSNIRWAEAKAGQKVLKQALSEEVKLVSYYEITNGVTHVKQHLAT